MPVAGERYETGTSVAVRAFHVMPGMPPPEGERHAHDYRLDVVVSRADLDERGMVVDLDRLDEVLGSVAAALDGADLEPVVGADEVTVERFARWLHDRLAEGLGRSAAVTLSVRVWESTTAFGGYTGEV